jgi:hypothetical protein
VSDASILPAGFADLVRNALLSLEGSVVAEFQIPLPGNLKDISKASALVSGVVEDRIPALLNSVRETTWDARQELRDFEFRKFDIGFPDILLVRRSDPTESIFEIEAKSWYILSKDPLTARFLTSRTVIKPATLVAVVAWVLDGVVSGSPVLLRIYVDEATRLAEVRDERWVAIEPEGSHRVLDPDNAPGTPRSAIRTQASGEIQTASGSWRRDSDNYGKLDRLYDTRIKDFRRSTLSLSMAGKTLDEWRAFIGRASAGVVEEDLL